MMKASLVHCPKCQSPLPNEFFNAPELQPCPACESLLKVELFSAFFRTPAPIQTGEAIMAEGEASCFYHPQKKAALPCEVCGRFMCALCDTEFNGQHLCPPCLESGKRKGKIINLQNQRTLYDNLAFTVALLPFCISAPAAIYITLRHWNAPSSIIPRTKVRFILALLISILQLLAAGMIFYFRPNDR